MENILQWYIFYNRKYFTVENISQWKIILPADVIIVMLEDTLVCPELSSPGQLWVPAEGQHVAGGDPG